MCENHFHPWKNFSASILNGDFTNRSGKEVLSKHYMNKNARKKENILSSLTFSAVMRQLSYKGGLSAWMT